jgi:hypothetical protein
LCDNAALLCHGEEPFYFFILFGVAGYWDAGAPPDGYIGGGGALATAVDVSTGSAVAAADDDAVSAVIPPSSTNDEDAYVGASVAFEGVP